MKICIERNDYTYNFPENWDGAQMVGYMPALVAAGEAVIALDKALEAIPDEGLTKYHSGPGVLGVVLALEGDPWGVITYLDNVVQFIPFNQERAQQ